MKRQKYLLVTCVLCLLAAIAYAESDPVMRYAAQKRLDTSRVTWMLMMSSVGELVRQSQTIVEGEITMLRVESEEKDTEAENGKVSPSSWADVRIDDVMRGDRDLIGESVAVEIRSTEPRPDEGFRGWMFLTRKPIDLWRDFPGLSRDRLSVSDLDLEEYEHWILAGGVRGCLTGDKAFVAELERYVDTYIRWFWAQDITAAEVAVMLGEMMESSHARLREDAVYDLSHMYASLSVDERQVLATDDRVPPQARDRIARRLERDEALATVRHRSRDELSSVLDDAHVQQAFESNDPRSIRKGLEVIDDLTRHERVSNPDLWAHLLRPHLDSKDPYIRWRAAVNLHQINDPAALRVLMETIQDLDPRYYDRLRNDLQKMTRQNLPLESDAPKEIQATQLRAWKDWWNLQEEEHQKRQNEGDIVVPLL